MREQIMCPHCGLWRYIDDDCARGCAPPPVEHDPDGVIARRRRERATEKAAKVAVALRMPSTIRAELLRRLPAAATPGAIVPDYAPNGALPIEVDNDLPRSTVRVVYGDGSTEDVRL